MPSGSRGGPLHWLTAGSPRGAGAAPSTGGPGCRSFDEAEPAGGLPRPGVGAAARSGARARLLGFLFGRSALLLFLLLVEGGQRIAGIVHEVWHRSPLRLALLLRENFFCGLFEVDDEFGEGLGWRRLLSLFGFLWYRPKG